MKLLLWGLLLLPGFALADVESTAAKENKDAAAVAAMVKEVAGSPEMKQEIYHLAADVLGNMKDLPPEQMQKMLQDAQKNPEAFTQQWTPEQQKRLKELSERMPAGQKKNP